MSEFTINDDEKPKRKPKNEIKVTKEQLEEALVLTKAKVKQLQKATQEPKAKKERTDAQKENWKRILEYNKSKKELALKEAEEKEKQLIKVKIAPPKTRKPKSYKPKPKASQPAQTEVSDSESEEETEQTEPEVRRIRQKAEKKIKAVEQINKQLETLKAPQQTNPYNSFFSRIKL